MCSLPSFLLFSIHPSSTLLSLTQTLLGINAFTTVDGRTLVCAHPPQEIPDIAGHQHLHHCRCSPLLWPLACLCHLPTWLKRSPILLGIDTFTTVDDRPSLPASRLKQCTFSCPLVICKSLFAHHVPIIINIYSTARTSYSSLFIPHSLVPHSETSGQCPPCQPCPLHCMFLYLFILCKFLRQYLKCALAMANGTTMLQLQCLQGVLPSGHSIDTH